MRNLHWLCIWLVIASVSALCWAEYRDPFRRYEFSLSLPGRSNASAMVVTPKKRVARPAIIWFQDDTQAVLESGYHLRQLAELGFVAVSIQMARTNELAFAAALSEVRAYLGRKGLAISNNVAWIGLDGSARRALTFAGHNPRLQPQLMVCISACEPPELRRRAEPAAGLGVTGIGCPVLLVSGTRERGCSEAEGRELLGQLQTSGTPAELRVVPGPILDFPANLKVVVRAVGEYCADKLMPRSIQEEERISYHNPPKGGWLFWLPAALWLLAWCGFACKNWTAAQVQTVPPRRRWGTALGALVAVLTTVLLAVAGVRLIVPRLRISGATTSIARHFLLPQGCLADFNYLAQDRRWQDQRVGTLLEHVSLAAYEKELMYKQFKFDQLENDIYRRFVLSPWIAESEEGTPDGASGETRWRRTLWENFYPRIRKETSPLAAAYTVVRFLRERVTIDPRLDDSSGIETIWRLQRTGEAGFRKIYVAALRSVGIPARLGKDNEVELWTGEAWQHAPGPLIKSFVGAGRLGR